MERTQKYLSAVSLVGSPLLILAYFATYPAYGLVHGDDIARAISADPGRTRTADIFAFAGAFLAVPAVLTYMRVLRRGSPRLAAIGGSLALLGWTSLVGVLMVDVVAAELGEQVTLFERVYSDPLVVVLNGLTSLHIVGAVMIGIALVRTRFVAALLAVAVTAAPLVHLAANLGGQLWLDAITWIVTAVTGAVVASRL